MAEAPDVSNPGQRDVPPDLRIVLIGGSELNGCPSGKSSAGNIILGQSVFDTSRRTAQSEARQQEVLSRHVTVVDTPGWWWIYTLQHTTKLDQIEIQKSVHLCPPGPHAFLLVIPNDLYLYPYVQPSLKQHLDLFSADVFSHTIVLFTAAAPCRDENIEFRIKRSPTLQWILQQCGNRKHVLNIRDREDRAQVKMLFEKIDAMLADNRGRHYSVDGAHGNALREEMKVWAEGASKRFDQVQKQRKELRALIEGGKIPPEHFRLVIIGPRRSAKSSAGNTILGKMPFDINNGGRRTTCCKISHSLVADRRLTVVDSPGWIFNHTLQETSEMDKVEIENSMNLCPPGPHAVLLGIELSTAVNATDLRSVQEHMSLFSEEIWKHTIVLFARGDWLGVKTVEERIESDEGLQWMVNKCENRYHVLNNKDHSDKTQVEELLDKIEEMWAGNENPYYEVDPSRAAEIEAKKEAGDKKAKRIKEITGRQSRVLKELFEDTKQSVTDMKIILVGQKCSGKSMTGNMILFNERFDLNFDISRLQKDIQDQRRPAACVKHEGRFDGVKVTVVETPGWFRDTTPPDWIKEEVSHGVSMCAPGPHVVLLVVPVLTSFTEKDLKDLVEVLRPFTDRVWRHCMVLFTMGDFLNERPVEDYIVREGRSIQELLEKCGNRYHLLNYWHFGDPAPIKELFQNIIDLVTRNKGCFTTKDKQRTFQKLPQQKTMTEEEWNRREQQLIERVMKALEKEPEKQTVPSMKVAHSMDEGHIPDLSGDVASEFGSISELRTQRAHDQVSEWLMTKVRQTEISSGIGSVCSSAAYMESLNESRLMAENQTTNRCFLEKSKVVSPHMSFFSNTAQMQRRNSC
uniref:AIG1-type G domain-containing protein n=1 Tax=Kryptolebias marmoratus TaxID=37003 RepID=A0A3Q3BFR7_KRYMA